MYVFICYKINVGIALLVDIVSNLVEYQTQGRAQQDTNVLLEQMPKLLGLATRYVMWDMYVAKVPTMMVKNAQKVFTALEKE